MLCERGCGLRKKLRAEFRLGQNERGTDMKKHIAIQILGKGNMGAAARAIGCTRQAIQQWSVDEFDNLTSRVACDMVLAAMVRLQAEHRLEHDELLFDDLDEPTLADLLVLPA